MKKLTLIFVFIILFYNIINSVEYVVVKGDCLWNIAKSYYKNPFLWKKIYEFNKNQISNPDLIYPGQRFFLPEIENLPQELSSQNTLQNKVQTEISEFTTTYTSKDKDTIKEENIIQSSQIEKTSLSKEVIENIKEEDLLDELQSQKEIENQKEYHIKEKEETVEVIFQKPKLEEFTKIFPKKIKQNEAIVNAYIKNAKEKKIVYIDFDIVYCEIKNNIGFKKDDLVGIYHLGPSKYDTSLMNVPKDELNLIGILKIKETNDTKSTITGEIIRCFSPITIGDLIISKQR